MCPVLDQEVQDICGIMNFHSLLGQDMCPQVAGSRREHITIRIKHIILNIN